MEHSRFSRGDVVKTEYDSTCYIVLKVEEDKDLLFCLNYNMETFWFQFDECQKVGSCDSIFKAMYDLNLFNEEYRNV